jgi:DNA helicase IV
MMTGEIAIDKLTPLQRQIVSAPAQGEIIVGGVAGSGKTTAAVYRAAHLCATTPRRKNNPTVLFLCFNTALRDAIQRQISSFPSNVWSRVKVSTVHFAARTCRASMRPCLCPAQLNGRL